MYKLLYIVVEWFSLLLCNLEVLNLILFSYYLSPFMQILRYIL